MTVIYHKKEENPKLITKQKGQKKFSETSFEKLNKI